MKLVYISILAVLLTNCTLTMRDAYYTRSEIDAINARKICLSMARTLVQVARCDVR